MHSFLLALALPWLNKSPARQPAPNARPALVVLISVDQMRPDYLELFGPQLHGGLARLYRGGAVFSNAFHDHAITETAPGHASILSGRFPRSTGIVVNSKGVEDPQAPLIGGGGLGASPFRFRGTALFDWMRLQDPASRALSVSRKDRGAILPMGRAKQQVYWYAFDGRFTTSTYYADTLPSWVVAFNSRKLPQQWAGKRWDLLLDAKEYAEPDSVAAEGFGQDFVFPHALPLDSAKAAAALLGYPAMDALTLTFALEGVRQLRLGEGPHTDLLSVSLSSTDAVGHRYGPDSREMHDQILRLDAALGAFLDSLFAMRDSSQIIIALTADHGVAPPPEAQSRYPTKGAGRVDVEPMLATLFASLRSAGVDTSAFDFDLEPGTGVLLLDADALSKARLNADAVAQTFEQEALKLPGLRVDLVRRLARQDTLVDYVARRWIHMLPPDLPAFALVSVKPYWYWKRNATYATHGSPHDYDARVPLILYGTAVKPGQYGQRVLVVDLAPTLAQLIGVKPLERLDGHPLMSAIRN